MAGMVKKSKTVNRFGIDPNTKPHWLTKLRKYLEDQNNIDKMDDVEQITALAKFRYNPGIKKYNCDITISSALALVCYEDEEFIQVMSSTETIEEDKPIGYREINGKLRMI